MDTVEYTFEYTGSIQTLAVVPATYYVQVWGAQGGSIAGYRGGYGGYSYGYIFNFFNTTWYIAVGGQGQTTINNTSLWAYGGFNGGGNGHPSGGNTSYTQASGGGGGASHIALKTGCLNTLSGYQSDILIVAGGGGGCGIWGNGAMTNGGNGGGLSGASVTNKYNNVVQGGTQTSGYAFGQGGSGVHADEGGGGGGWYGGYASAVNNDDYISGGGGGSGYLSSNIINGATSTSTHTGNGLVKIQLIYFANIRTNSNFYQNVNLQNAIDFNILLGE